MRLLISAAVAALALVLITASDADASHRRGRLRERHAQRQHECGPGQRSVLRFRGQDEHGGKVRLFQRLRGQGGQRTGSGCCR